MTLVAACRIKGVPVLIGDLLLTEKAPGPRTFLPTRNVVRGDGPPPPPRLLSKKIHRISDGFVVGFTGAAVVGAALVQKLVERFEGIVPSPSELQTFLAMLDLPRREEAMIVGWLCTERSWTSFAWRGEEPAFLELTEMVAGSGAAHFQSNVDPADRVSWGGGLDTAVEQAGYEGICNIGKLLSEEVSRGRNLEADYGFGGEVLVWSGTRFRYVADVAYTFWDITVDGQQFVSVSLAKIIVRYRTYDRFSVMQTTHVGETGNGLVADKTFLQAVLPIDWFGLDPDETLQRIAAAGAIRRLPLDAAVWFAGIFARNVKNGSTSFLGLVSERTEGGLVEYKGGNLFLSLEAVRGNLERDFFC